MTARSGARSPAWLNGWTCPAPLPVPGELHAVLPLDQRRGAAERQQDSPVPSARRITLGLATATRPAGGTKVLGCPGPAGATTRSWPLPKGNATGPSPGPGRSGEAGPASAAPEDAALGSGVDAHAGPGRPAVLPAEGVPGRPLRHGEAHLGETSLRVAGGRRPHPARREAGVVQAEQLLPVEPAGEALPHGVEGDPTSRPAVTAPFACQRTVSVP